MIQLHDATARLQRRLLTDALAAGCAITALEADSGAVPWHSAGFDGTRHHLHFQVASGVALDAWLAMLETREWRMSGQLVIDWALERIDSRLILTALSLDPDRA